MRKVLYDQKGSDIGDLFLCHQRHKNWGLLVHFSFSGELKVSAILYSCSFIHEEPKQQLSQCYHSPGKPAQATIFSCHWSSGANQCSSTKRVIWFYTLSQISAAAEMNHGHFQGCLAPWIYTTGQSHGCMVQRCGSDQRSDTVLFYHDRNVWNN